MTDEEKIKAYDKLVEAHRKGAQKTNNVPAKVRSERAKKAVQARWAKRRKLIDIVK